MICNRCIAGAAWSDILTYIQKVCRLLKLYTCGILICLQSFYLALVCPPLGYARGANSLMQSSFCTRTATKYGWLEKVKEDA